MRRSSGLPLIQGLRRRGRATVLCVVVLVLIGLTLFSDHSSSYLSGSEETGKPHDRLSKYLEVVSAWTRAKPTHTQTVSRPEPSLTGIDKFPDIPPTLHEDTEDVLSEVEADVEADSGTSGLPGHNWDKNGLLTVNPDGAHPIYEIVRHAENQWAAKQRRASRTLEDAVREYRRRYKRLPPRGFDRWWNYVQKYNVQLPDEYDQIYNDLEPYWGIDPLDLQEAQSLREGISESYTIGKRTPEGIITLLNMSVSEGQKGRVADFMSWGAKPQMDLLNEVYRYIPTFRATFSPHDSPSELVDWTWRSAAVGAAKRGIYLKPEDLPPQERTGWSGACPRDSPLYLNPPGQYDEPTPQTSKTFIHDHRAAMDPCYHPQHVLTHGTFLSHGIGPHSERFPAPMLSNCASPLHGDIRATSMSQSSEFAIEDPRWEDKDDDRLFWRGTPTGMWHYSGVSWRSSQRVRLVNLTNADAAGSNIDPELEFAHVSFLNPGASATKPVGRAKTLTRHRANEALMDISFSGSAQGCEGEVCETMQKELQWSEKVEAGARGAGRYKYLLDVDGNGWSSRFRRLMSAHALVFKSTLFPEWWVDRVQPWVHYVPVQLDYSDLYDSLLFFGGDLSGEGAHEEMAKRIASAGRQWVEQFWRNEDVTAYMFRLWLEYARVMSSDRDEMNYQLPQKS